jgi:hypothetical protein
VEKAEVPEREAAPHALVQVGGHRIRSNVGWC